MTKQKKLYYVPGLISLFGLFILLFVFRPLEKLEIKGTTRINLPTDEKIIVPDKFTKGFIYNFLKRKKIEQIYLDEFDENGNISAKKLNFIKAEAERLQNLHDTSTVLKISFSKENTYGNFIEILDIAYVYEFKRFAFYDDEFLLVPNKKVPSYNSNTLLVTEYEYEGSGKWQIFCRQIEDYYYLWEYSLKHFKLISFGFIFLILVPAIINLFLRFK